MTAATHDFKVGVCQIFVSAALNIKYNNKNNDSINSFGFCLRGVPYIHYSTGTLISIMDAVGEIKDTVFFLFFQSFKDIVQHC